MADVEELCKRVIIIDGGRILYDGDLSKIVERYAPDKLVTLTSSVPLDIAGLKALGKVISHNGSSAELEIPRKDVSRVMGLLLAQVPVVDLSIEELPIEEIIRRVFLENG